MKPIDTIFLFALSTAFACIVLAGLLVANIIQLFRSEERRDLFFEPKPDRFDDVCLPSPADDEYQICLPTGKLTFTKIGDYLVEKPKDQPAEAPPKRKRRRRRG